ncbi:MAG TPA: hypothetical protein VGK77_23145 [Candidatus Binatia bacterium]
MGNVDVVIVALIMAGIAAVVLTKGILSPIRILTNQLARLAAENSREQNQIQASSESNSRRQWFNAVMKRICQVSSGIRPRKGAILGEENSASSLPRTNLTPDPSRRNTALMKLEKQGSEAMKSAIRLEEQTVRFADLFAANMASPFFYFNRNSSPSPGRIRLGRRGKSIVVNEASAVSDKMTD